MRRFVSVVAVFLGLALSLAAQSATIAEVAGKVEYQIPGKDWKPARVGDVLPKGTIVSTGFKSTAVLKVENATITVKPVTRLSLEEILATQSGTQTNIRLVSGRVAADVTPQKGRTTDFKVTSPTATASVRGTSFEFDGVNLLVGRGVVELRTPTQQFRIVQAQEFSFVTSTNAVQPPAAVAANSNLQNVGSLIDQSMTESQVVSVTTTSATGSTSVPVTPVTPPSVTVTSTVNVIVE